MLFNHTSVTLFFIPLWNNWSKLGAIEEDMDVAHSALPINFVGVLISYLADFYCLMLQGCRCPDTSGDSTVYGEAGR